MQVQAGAVRLNCVVEGAGQPLLLVHGLGASHLDFEAAIPLLAREFRVIAPDLRGCGESERPAGGYRIGQFARDLWALLDALGVREPLVVGHSLGGAVAVQMALSRPGAIARLVIANSMPSFRPRRLAERAAILLRRLLMRLLGPAVLARVMAGRQFPRPEQAALREQMARRGRANDPRVYLAALGALTRWDVRRRLRKLELPVLVLASEHDYFTPADSQAYAAAIPGARLQVVAGAHHVLPVEQPQAFAEAVRAFMAPPARAPRPASAAAAAPGR